MIPEQPLHHGHNPVAPEPEEALLQGGCFIVPPKPFQEPEVRECAGQGR